VRLEPRFGWIDNLDQERFPSVLSVPIISHERVISVMNTQTTDANAYSAEETLFVEAMARFAAILEISTLAPGCRVRSRRSKRPSNLCLH
jgi:signal transduction protein with GAF and PtsI domain